MAFFPSSEKLEVKWLTEYADTREYTRKLYW